MACKRKSAPQPRKRKKSQLWRFFKMEEASAEREFPVLLMIPPGGEKEKFALTREKNTSHKAKKNTHTKKDGK